MMAHVLRRPALSALRLFHRCPSAASYPRAHCSPQCLSFSTSPPPGDTAGEGEARPPVPHPLLLDAVVRVRGDPSGTREYVLLPPNLTVIGSSATNAPSSADAVDELEAAIQRSKLASLYSNRNVLFGARVHNRPDDDSDGRLDLIDACLPLVDRAKADAGVHGYQAQAVAALPGLCDWVADRLSGNDDDGIGSSSEALAEIIRRRDETGDDLVYEAIKAIATGRPRPGHSVVGAGTFRDGQTGWEALVKEYASTERRSGGPSEPALYRAAGAEIVGIEHLADTSEAYLRMAGGAMVRFFFL